ncbi:hypothetical protein [Novosphingobium rosa]|uniref:hypothetical protein n=1 Tax=Novosphingobium rosa TaxID=76978 RepID=UPI000AE28DFF|nr:hypothetical protein [Novosphingobium rosa]
MSNLLSGTSRYVAQMEDAGHAAGPCVRILRSLADDTHVVVWHVRLDTPEEAASIRDWLTSTPERLRFWGRVAFRLGPDAAGPVILASARFAEAERQEAERRERERIEEEARRADEITLYTYTPHKKAPYLGLERGNKREPFFVMRFDERWERDRVCDWLMYQKARFAEMERLFQTSGQLALEKHVLDGMLATEKDARRRGISAGGRRPLRFWRGE